MNGGYDSSGSEGGKIRTETSKSRRFNAAQIACLNAYFQGGMKGVGEQYLAMISQAAADTEISVGRIKVCLLGTATKWKLLQ